MVPVNCGTAELLDELLSTESWESCLEIQRANPRQVYFNIYLLYCDDGVKDAIEAYIEKGELNLYSERDRLETMGAEAILKATDSKDYDYVEKGSETEYSDDGWSSLDEKSDEEVIAQRTRRKLGEKVKNSTFSGPLEIEGGPLVGREQERVVEIMDKVGEGYDTEWDSSECDSPSSEGDSDGVE